MIATARTTMVLQPEVEHDPGTRAEVRIYIGDQLVATQLKPVSDWPDCRHCGDPVDVMVEAHATPDGLHHDGCTPRPRKRKAKA